MNRDQMGPSRRDFLIQCCQTASVALVPAALPSLPLPFVPAFYSEKTRLEGGGFHLHPQYRSQTPLDATLLKKQPGSDVFITEKYHEPIAAILANWSEGLLKSARNLSSIESVLEPAFLGSSLRPLHSRVVRSGPSLEIRHDEFVAQALLERDAFLRELHSALSAFSQLLVAEFEVTSIDADTQSLVAALLPGEIKTRVRYEVVGTGPEFYREQRIGEWELEWEVSSSVAGSIGEFRLKRWLALGETRSRCGSAAFVDITAQALGGNSSYSSQLLRGIDYWRTVLDGACGIDVYGHNGISAGDFDGDGFDDLYVCQPAGVPNRLYRNRGDGTFEDVTEAAGVGLLENTACALFVDINNDGRQDLIVVGTSGPALFLNQGGGNFRRKANAFQFASPPQGTFTGAAVADYDRDGWLDIYFCLYAYYQGAGQYRYPSPYYDAENGPPNFLLRNNRDGTFRDVTASAGLNRNNTRYSFCCGWSDYDGDGWPDLYVVNDFGRNNLYRNNGDGTFADLAGPSGVEDIGAGMSVCWFDYNNDGADDLYVANMWTAAGKRITEQEVFQKDAPEKVRALYRKHAMGNSLFRNRGSNRFEDTSASAGIDMGRWSWSSDAWDFDHDGFSDLYVTNGMVSGTSDRDLNSFFWRQVVANSPQTAKASFNYEQGWNGINELIRSDETWSGYERNVFYANNRDGTFSDVSGALGLDFIEDGRAFALSDFDHDGRLEVFLKNRNAPQVRVLKNVMGNLPAAIAFRLNGTNSNRDAIGAVVMVETEAGRQVRTVQAGSGFLSQHTKEVFFGLGRAKGPVRASIRWPNGLVQELRDLPANHRVWVEEGNEPSQVEAFKPTSRNIAVPQPQKTVPIPERTETWLIAPITAPDFSLPDTNGEVRSLAALRGKPVILNFWSARSPESQQELAVFNRWHTSWAAHGLQLLAVNVDDSNDAEGLRSLARARRYGFPVLLGSQDVAGIYNILYRHLFDRHRDLRLPSSLLIDERGEIVKVYAGRISAERLERDFRSIPRTTADRLTKALPFPGVTDRSEFRRNYLSLGSVFFQRGYLDQAEASFRLALRADPNSAEALYGLGSIYLEQKKVREARDAFAQSIRVHASYPDTLPNAWNNLGLLATQEALTDEAILHFQEALRLSPDHLIALKNLGNAYRQQKQWEDARRVLERAVQVSPEDPEANYGLGMVFAQLDDTARAYRCLRTALEFRPAYPEALNNLGILYLRTHRRNEGVASFEECIRVAPTFDQCYLNLARVYSLESAPEKARTVLLKLLKQHPNHLQAQQMLEQLHH